MPSRDPHTRRTVVFSVAAVVFLGVLFLVHRMSAPRSLGAVDAYVMLRRDTTVIVLDVRTAEEFRSSTGRLERAVLIPVESLGSRAEELSGWRGRTILVYCRSGRRSRNAVTLLEKRGHAAVNLEGGILEWIASGLPVVKEKEQR